MIKSKFHSSILIALVLILLSSACAAPSALPATPAPTIPLPSSTPVPTHTPTIPPTPTLAAPTTAAPTVTETIPTVTSSAASESAAACSPNPAIADILADTSASRWLDWVKELSGAVPVSVGGQQVTFSTRYTPSMFGSTAPSAFDFVLETVQGWYPAEQIQVQSFRASARNQRIVSGKNLILTIPGEDLNVGEANDVSNANANANRIVILSAHLDSITHDAPELAAPGAEDNASGSAALLEAARLFRGQRFQHTLRLIWFTGEEEGLLGSKAYVNELKNPSEVMGVINLDMFGYDSDDDGCFELHVGTLPASDRVGQCFLSAYQAYGAAEPGANADPGVTAIPGVTAVPGVTLPQPDYLLQSATGSSDHSSFWAKDIGAIEVLENLFPPEGAASSQTSTSQAVSGCTNRDMSPNYHTSRDTADRLNPTSAIRIVRAALAAAAAMAGLLP